MNEWIDISVPYLFGKEKEYLLDCINSNFISSVGPLISNFENKISFHLGLDDGCTTATASGTSALHLALIVAGVKKDELVIMPDYTFIATANAINHSGGIPWLMDIEKESLTIDTIKLNKILKEETTILNNKCIHKVSGKRVAAIVPVFTLGHPPDLDRLKIISDKYHLPLISDAAAGIGSKYKDKDIGKKSLITCFSFNGNKSITSGGGGALCSFDKTIVEEAKHIASTARVGPGYNHNKVGFNYRMTNIQAAIGLGQIENINKIIQKKKYIAQKYKLAFKNNTNVISIPEAKWAKSAKWLSGFIIKKDSELNPNKIIEYLNSKKIRVREFWKPMHLQDPYKYSISNDIKFSKYIWQKIIILPSSTSITEDELSYVIKTTNEAIT